MPFLRPGEGASPAGGASTLRVDPEKVLQLKADLRPIFDKVDVFLRTKGRTMMMQPLGADPVSSDAAEVFNENAQTALDAAWGYHAEMERVINSLDQIARTYNLVEDSNTQTFQQGVQ